MIAKSLHQAGYEVDTCNDGEEALEMICAEMYDLIVLDLNLPGMDGMDILRELRKENEIKQKLSGPLPRMDSGSCYTADQHSHPESV